MARVLSCIAVCSVLLGSACQKKSFNAGTQVAKPGTLEEEPKEGDAEKPNTLPAPAPAPNPSTINDDTKKAKLSLEFASANDSVLKGEAKKKLPLAIYFVVDTTASMQRNIDAVRLSINNLLPALFFKGFEMKVGIIAFRDDVKHIQPLTDNTIEIGFNLGTQLYVGGGDDEPEAAILATKKALESLHAEASKDSIKAMFLFTDNVGHWGTGSSKNRDCNIDPLVKAFNDLSPEQQQLTKIYYAVSSMPTNPLQLGPCTTHKSASEQFDAILQNSLSSVPLESRGGSLSYPLQADAVTNDLKDLITKTTDIDALCLATKADLHAGGKILASWSASVEDTFNKYSANQNIQFRTDLAADQESSAKAGELKVSQCCLSRDDAKAGKFDKCRMSTKSAPFQVIVE